MFPSFGERVPTELTVSALHTMLIEVGIDMWRSCWFIGALMRSLCTLPGGIGRFVICRIGLMIVKAHWVGEVWTWAYFWAEGDCRGGLP